MDRGFLDLPPGKWKAGMTAPYEPPDLSAEFLFRDRGLRKLRLGNGPADHRRELELPIALTFSIPEEGEVPLEVLEELRREEPRTRKYPVIRPERLAELSLVALPHEAKILTDREIPVTPVIVRGALSS